ncbi:hypothetical protein D3C72_1154880 [compost metagenome]
MLGVAVGQIRRREQVALLGAGGQARRGARALDVEDHHGDLGVVSQARELGHQADAGAGGRGHGAGARPAGADGHAEGCQFVFGLNHGEAGLAVRLGAVGFQKIDQALAEARARGDRVPGEHLHAGHQAADRRGRVAVDDHLAGGRLHARHAEGALGLVQVLLGPGQAGLGGFEVDLDGLGLALEDLLHGLFDLGHVEVQQMGQDAHVDDVGDQLAQLGVRARRGDDLAEGHAADRDVGARGVELEIGVEHDGGACSDLGHVLEGRLGVHHDHHVDFLGAGDPAVFVGADGEPGGQAGDVGREEVLAAHRHAHLEDGAHEDFVGGLRARAVDGRDLDAEVVDDRLAGRPLQDGGRFLMHRCLLRTRGSHGTPGPPF